MVAKLQRLTRKEIDMDKTELIKTLETEYTHDDAVKIAELITAEQNKNSTGVVNLSNLVRRRLCEHHPDVDYKNEWGCPRCLAELRRSLEFYKTRTNEIQKYQKELPEPHRTVICNILANGKPSA